MGAAAIKHTHSWRHFKQTLLGVLLLCVLAAAPLSPASAQPTIPGLNPATAGAPAPRTPPKKHGEESVQDIMNNFSGLCLACGISARVFAASMLYGKAIFPVLGVAVAKFLAVVFVLWTLWHIVKLYAPFMPAGRTSDISSMLFGKGALTLFIALILMSNTSYNLYWEYVYKPVVTVSINLSNALLQEGANAQASSAYVVKSFTLPDGKQCSKTNITGLSEEEKALQHQLECQIHTLQNAFTYGLALGWWLIWNENVFIGIILCAISIMPPITFAVMILDALMRWTLISVCMPAVFGCYVFNSSRNFAINAFKGLLESGLTLSIVAIVAVMTAGITQEAVKQAKIGIEASGAAIGGAVQGATGGGGVVTQSPTSGLVRERPLQQAVPANNQAAAPAATGGTCQNIVVPCDGRNNAGLTGLFGASWGGINTARPGHAGIDIVCKIDEYLNNGNNYTVLSTAPVWAAAAGKVIQVVNTDNSRAGKFVTILHDDGFSTRYLHLSAINVKEGDRVAQKQIIGIQGHTGGLGTNNIHLHFEVYDANKNLINPDTCLAGKTPPTSGIAGTGSNTQTASAMKLGFGDLPLWYLLFVGLLSFSSMKSSGLMASELLQSPMGGVAMGAGAMMNTVQGALGGVVGGGIGAVAVNATAIADKASDMAGAGNLAMQVPGVSGAVEGIGNAGNAVMSRVGDMGNAIANNPMVQGAGAAMQNMGAGLQDLGGRISGVAADMGGRISSATQTALSGLQDVATNIVPEGVRNTTAAFVNSDAVQAVGKAAGETATGLGGAIAETGRATALGVGAGATAALVNTVGELTGTSALIGGMTQGFDAGSKIQFRTPTTEEQVARMASLNNAISGLEDAKNDNAAMRHRLNDANSDSFIANDARRNSANELLDIRDAKADANIEIARLMQRDRSGNFDNLHLLSRDPAETLSGKWDAVANTKLFEAAGRLNDTDKKIYTETMAMLHMLPDQIRAMGRDPSSGRLNYEIQLEAQVKKFEHMIDRDTRSLDPDSSEFRRLQTMAAAYEGKNPEVPSGHVGIHSTFDTVQNPPARRDEISYEAPPPRASFAEAVSRGISFGSDSRQTEASIYDNSDAASQAIKKETIRDFEAPRQTQVERSSDAISSLFERNEKTTRTPDTVQEALQQAEAAKQLPPDPRRNLSDMPQATTTQADLEAAKLKAATNTKNEKDTPVGAPSR